MKTRFAKPPLRWRHLLIAGATALLSASVVVRGQAMGGIAWRSDAGASPTLKRDEIAPALNALAMRPGAKRCVMQFTRPLGRAERADLSRLGVSLLNYLGDNAYFVRLNSAAMDADALARGGLIGRAEPIRSIHKKHSLLNQRLIPTWAVTDRDFLQAVADEEGDINAALPHLPADPHVVVYVLFHPDVTLVPMGAIRAAQRGGSIISPLHSLNGLVIDILYSRIEDLAGEDDVMYIEPALPKMAPLNDSSRTLSEVELVQAAPYDLDGTGVSVMVYDGGSVLASHPDLNGRTTVRDLSVLTGHATHVAGTLGGAGDLSAGKFRGMAPNVTLESYGFEQAGGPSPALLFSDPGDLEADYDEAVNVHGIDLVNNSIGSNVALNGSPCEWTGDYGVTSALIDAIVGGSLGAPLRVVFSNGNERGVTTCGDTFKSTAPPACAKNHITVGAVNSNDDTMTAFSSWGPSDDGRLKPDLVAPGCQANGDMAVTSTSEVGSYSGRCGTSMAAPVVTGIGALLLQDFRTQFPSRPDFRNSTLKALLTHSAQDIGNVGPDFKHGYGSVRAQAAVDLMRSGSFFEGVVDHDGVIPAFVDVPPGTLELKVTIAWDDVPGTPNVSPSLVNDLDLVVVEPTNGEQFPWTLDAENPGLPAVRTQADHINNIEQVVIDNPPPGLYRIEVRGFNVPVGPQTFSLTATPTLLPCSSVGSVAFDLGAYLCESTATIQVIDCDLNTDSMVAETISVTLASTTDPAGEILLLTEITADSAAFRATIPLSLTDAIGVLGVSNGDMITATYIDADDGTGGIDVVVTDTAAIDCQIPATTSVMVSDVTPSAATVTVQTNEPAALTLLYGTDCLTPTSLADSSLFITTHVFNLTGLADDTTHFFSLVLVDPATNQSVDDNGGLCYQFKTQIAIEPYTELFEADDFDLSEEAIVFRPDGSLDFYSACRVPITGLPVDPAGATPVVIPDDASLEFVLTGGAMIPFYGTSYSSFFLGSNGYVTFGVGDESRHESFAAHFSLPRIAALFDDLNPAAGGTVSWEQLADRVVVTFEQVPRFSTSLLNTFQIEMFFAGPIRMSWVDIQLTNALVGLSKGLGLPAEFFESDLSVQSVCSPRFPVADGAVEQVISNRILVFSLNAQDDGLPALPGALDYVLLSLPTGEVRDNGNGSLITPGDLPYTLVGGGNMLSYVSPTDFVGVENLRFRVDDGGSAPDGGPSNSATVLVDVVAPIVGDGNFDGIVDIDDFLLVLSEWGPCGSCGSDFDNDGIVGITDFLAVLANWGQVLPPPPPANSNSIPPDGAAPDRDAPDGVGNSPDTFINDGLLAPAREGGLIRIDRDFRQTPRGELAIELAGPRPVEEYDLLVVKGRVRLGGMLSATCVDACDPGLGDRFVFLVAEQVVGRFAAFDLPDPPLGAQYEVVYLNDVVMIDVVAADRRRRRVRGPLERDHRSGIDPAPEVQPVFGDLNEDGLITVADVGLLLGDWSVVGSGADLDDDGGVDATDLTILLEQLVK